MDVDLVLFDAGHTLIYPDPPVGRVYADALAEAGVPADADEVARRFAEVWTGMRRAVPEGLGYGTSEREAIAWWRRVVRASVEPFGQPRDFEALFARLWEHFATGQAWRVYDDVLPALDELERRGKRLGLVSNWDVRLTRVLGDLGLLGRFQAVAISAQVGAEKPSPAIFRHALDQAGVAASRALHVGDSYEEDFLGAKAAGLNALWLQRDGAAPCPDAIRSLAEVPARVR